MLKDQNELTLSYRKEHFSRIKKGNHLQLQAALEAGEIIPLLQSNLQIIEEHSVTLKDKDGQMLEIENDKVFIFAGGELPIPFLKESGINVERTFGKTMRKH